jgi:putative ABC transport system permease protein
MREVFGLPAGPFALVLAVLLAAALGTVTVLAVRNPVFLRMGVRNIPRRKGRTVLIVVGLMLGTAIIAAALLTGDTMAQAVRASAVRALGAVDERVTAGTTAEIAGTEGLDAAQPYFAAAPAVAAIEAAAGSLPIDGVVGAIVEPAAAQHADAGRTEPKLVLLAPDPSGAAAFGLGEVTDLSSDEALLSDEAADALDAAPGSRITLLVGGRVADLDVVGVGPYRGSGATDGAAVVVALETAQRLLDRPGEVNQVLVSNAGGVTEGAAHTSTVEPALDAAVAPLGLGAQPTKADALDDADETGDAFVQLFTTFGTFSMAAGVLLIFLIFVMLAAERRPEMGMARAVGTQRRHLVQTFLYEGTAYDLVAAAVGAALGIAVSFVMVRAVAASFAETDLDLGFTLSWRSLWIAFGLGVLLTLVVVTISSWRVSRLNIVSAIRDIPEPPRHRRRGRRWAGVTIGLALGAVLAISGASGHQFLPWMLGLSLIFIACAPILQSLTGSARLAYTLSGSAVLVIWLLPFSFFDQFLGELSMDFTVWVVGGLVMVVVATWLVSYNADVLLGLMSWLASPFRSWRPVVKMAVAYPLKSRFRTAVTMSMFMLVVFTLVTGSTIPTAFTRAFDDVDRFGGGFDVRVTTAPSAAVGDLRPELPADAAGQISVDATQSYVPVEARQVGTEAAFERYPARGLNDAFLDRTTYGFSAMAVGYESPEEVWQALAADPTLAVVDGFVAPRRAAWGFGAKPAFQLSGFYIEDGPFAPVPVELHDPLSGTTIPVTVIGVLDDNAPFTMAGVTVSDRTLAPLGDRSVPTIHHLAVSDGADPTTVADRVEASLLDRGAEATTYAELLDDAVGANLLFVHLVQGFMALGLVVGVAALGVICARSVVERRQQLGMLRAIGFQPQMIRRTLLTETSIVAGSAIAVGTTLGLVVSYNVIADSQDQLGFQNLTFQVPWANLAVIFGAVLLAALATAAAAARRATRIFPAEALRYQ